MAINNLDSFTGGHSPVINLSSGINLDADVNLIAGDALDRCKTLPDESIQLVVSSPPYGIGKSYEQWATIDAYIASQAPLIGELFRVLKPEGSVCWQVGNHVDDGEILPLDIVFYPVFKEAGFHLRNQIAWHFRHGLHCTYRLSGRHESIMWFTKTADIHGYTFNLDAIRISQKYPGKRKFKGEHAGELSCNPAGKNPSDMWEIMLDEWEEGIWDIPNVKSNHPEKTPHPCQFPVELAERCVLMGSNPGDIVLDPYGGVSTVAIAAIKNGRKAICIDKEQDYIDIGKDRIMKWYAGELKTREIGTSIYQQKWEREAEQVRKNQGSTKKGYRLDKWLDA